MASIKELARRIKRYENNPNYDGLTPGEACQLYREYLLAKEAEAQKGIELGSTSYPYMAVSKHFGIPYADVISYLDRIPSATLQRHLPWMKAVWAAWEKQNPEKVDV